MKNFNSSWPQVPASFHAHLLDTLKNLPEQREFTMMKRKISIRKIATVCACAVVATGVFAFASGKVTTIFSSSSSTPTYQTIPSEQTVQKEIGLANVQLPKKFSNGYTFAGGTKVNNENADENGASMGKYYSLDANYQKDGNRLNLSVTAAKDSQEDKTEPVEETYQNVALYYSQQTYKFVPPDYKLTAQDKEDQASGKYVFSYGSQKVETSEDKFVRFTIGDNEYLLMGMDTPLDKADLLAMAKEYIDQQAA